MAFPFDFLSSRVIRKIRVSPARTGPISIKLIYNHNGSLKLISLSLSPAEYYYGHPTFRPEYQLDLWGVRHRSMRRGTEQKKPKAFTFAATPVTFSCFSLSSINPSSQFRLPYPPTPGSMASSTSTRTWQGSWPSDCHGTGRSRVWIWFIVDGCS